MKPSWRVPLLVGLVGAASSYACSFGANDFKIVPKSGSAGSAGEAGASDNGGSSAHGGSVAHGGSAGSTTAGASGAAGEAGASDQGGADTGGTGGSGTAGSGTAGSGTAGSGGSGGGTTMLSCSNQTPKPLVLMSYTDLHQVDQIDHFVMVTSPNSVYAIAALDVQNAGLNQTHLIIRAVSDSSSGAVRGIADIPMQNHFQFGGAWATPTEIDIVGGDQRGIVQLTIPLDNGFNPINDVTRVTTTMLDTPPECMNNLRAVSIANSADGLSFVASCIPDSNNQNAISLWINSRATNQLSTLIAPANPNATNANPDIDNIVRGFVHNGSAGNNLIFVGQDFGTVDFRSGSTTNALMTVSKLSLSADTSLLEGAFATGLSDTTGGIFMVGATLHDPNAGNLWPVNIFAGKIPADSYTTLTRVPPAQLVPVRTYDSGSDIEFPSDVTIRGTLAFVAASNPLQKQNVYLWALGTSGGPLMADFTVYTGTDTISNLAIGRFTLNNVLAWEASTADGSNIYGASVGCF
jgi:hypothetical protein